MHIAARVSGHPARTAIGKEEDILKILHAVSHTLASGQEAGDTLALLRQMHAQSPEQSLLLFCDLPDAACQKLPDEQPLIQSLLRGISAMNDAAAPHVFLLIRSRVWSDAERMYLGGSQMLSCREAIAQLITHGQTQTEFEAASVSPASLKGGFDAVLFSDLSLVCAPDVPLRMAAYLAGNSIGAVGAAVLAHHEHPCSALCLLCARSPFSLSSIHTMQTYTLAQQGWVSCDHPVMYTVKALSRLDEIQSAPAAPSCAFSSRHAPTMQSIFRCYRRLCLKQPFPHACVPPLQFALLGAGAVFGVPLLAVCAALPELWALFHPRAWPGALLRTALLPLTALHALDLLLCRLLAHSPLLRLRVPVRLFSPLICLFAALALLTAALISVYALVAVLPFALLWLCMPVLYRTLDITEPGAITSGISSPNP